MFIFAYLRASTKEQDANRAKESLKLFAQERSARIAGWYVEHVSGASLDRPELMRLLSDAEEGDAILIEQVDRLSRLHDDDWTTLKNLIGSKRLKIISLDLPTSHMALSPDMQKDDFTESILRAVNNMLLDTLAAMARKDYTDRRRRQSQGIAKAKAEGKYTGRKADFEKHANIIRLRTAGSTIKETAKALSVSERTVVRVMEAHRKGISLGE
ncbi:recombinase family protein [Vibrio fluvialis]|nr:recombinase family protein [Vibrio fluvialis]